jgi:hypothetical protein
MGKLSGTVLILAGIALAGYTITSRDAGSSHPPEQHAAPDAGTKVAAAPHDGATEPAAVKEPSPPRVEPMAALPPAIPLVPQLENRAPAPKATDAQAPSASPPPAVVAPRIATQRRKAGNPPTVRLSEAPPRVPVGDSKPAGGPQLNGPALTRQIQRELKRIGCYQGSATGVWSPAVRQAMKDLTERTNASLPIEQPDPVLLAMAQSQGPGTCSASCPAGQARAHNGRCLPSALVAGAGTRRAQPPPTTDAKASADAPPVQTSSDLPARDGRMSLAGPRPNVTPPTRTARKTARSQRVGVAPRTRQANARVRGRQRAAQRSLYGFSGFPGWVPF